MRRFDTKPLIALATAPEDQGDPWYNSAEQAVQYMTANSESDEIVIYVSAPFLLIVGALAPTANVTPPDGDALQISHCLPMLPGASRGPGVPRKDIVSTLRHPFQRTAGLL